MQVIDIGNDFYHRLANRDETQGDGFNNAVMFREKYLKEFDNEEEWQNGNKSIKFDFVNVTKIGPSFANEAFAYFTKYKNATPANILKKFIFTNISNVKLLIISKELESGYNPK